MPEWIRLAAFALLLAAGLIVEVTAVFGANRFRFSLNRMHPAGMGDSLGLLLIALAVVVYTGWNALSLKVAAVVAVYWITSPLNTHLISRMVRETEEERMKAEAREWKP